MMPITALDGEGWDMARIGIIGGLAALGMGVLATIVMRRILPDGFGPLDDIDWYEAGIAGACG
jgi:hypothetical protein